MKAVLVVVVFLVSALVEAKVAVAKVATKNETVSTSFWRYYLRPPSRVEFEEDLEARWKQLEDDMAAQKAQFQLHMNELNKNLVYHKSELERDLKKTEIKLKKRIARDVFKQRQGWQRFRKSVRNHVGLVVGGGMTFAGGAWVEAATGLQAAHLSWFTLHKANVTRGLHDPWIKDALAGTVAVTAVLKLSETPLKDATGQTILSLLTIAMALGRSTGIITSNYFSDEVNTATKTALQLTITGIGCGLLYVSPIPLPFMAVSITGATIMYESLIDEIVGNWFYIVERLSPDKQRSLRQKVYHKIQQKMMYPVQSAFVQIHAAIYNETLATPTIQQKVHDAIHRSFQVRMVWTIATAGAMFQVLLNKPLQQTE